MHILFQVNFPDLEEKYGDNRFPTLQHTCDCGAEIYKDGKSFRKIDAMLGIQRNVLHKWMKKE